MRYLILANNSGGLYRFRKELMEQLLLEGHEVYAVTPFDDFIEELRALGVQLICREMNRRGKNPLQELSLLRAYRRIIRSVSPDYIITYTIKPGIYGGLLARAMHIPYAVNITGLGTAFQKKGLLQSIVVRLWRAAVSAAACVFFENAGNASVFTELGIVDESRVKILHGAGVNLTDFPFAEYPLQDGQLRLLFIGRVMREKGIDELLEAMERLHAKYPMLSLDVVGRFEEDYEKKLSALEDVVRFHGQQPDVTQFIRQAHAFVLPSYHEGMANTLLEAGAMGRPLITSRIHGCMEALIEGETGFLCEPGDVASLIEALERFLALSYEKKAAMGRRSHEFVAAHFDKNEVVAETVRCLTRME